ncbi:MAG TPA: hypothetical protein VGL56_05060 [Fimbriimonadaceae bacterium]|jgi:hypothetical protein
MESKPKTGRAAKIVALLIFIPVLIIAAALLAPQPKPVFAFVKVDHPIDMVRDSKGTWTYYFVGGKPSQLADNARPELVSKGFKEDLTNKPWFRFAKGNEEVIICNHNEIGYNSSRALFSGNVVHELDRYSGSKRPSYIADQSKTAVVWIRSGKVSDVELASFNVKRLVHGW